MAPLTRYRPCLSLVAVETAISGVGHVPRDPGCSGLGCGAARAVPLRLRINDTDVSRLNVERVFDIIVWAKYDENYNWKSRVLITAV